MFGRGDQSHSNYNQTDIDAKLLEDEENFKIFLNKKKLMEYVLHLVFATRVYMQGNNFGINVT